MGTNRACVCVLTLLALSVGHVGSRNQCTWHALALQGPCSYGMFLLHIHHVVVFVSLLLLPWWYVEFRIPLRRTPYSCVLARGRILDLFIL